MTDIAAIENLATLSRTTAGVYRYHGVDAVAEDRLHRYSRDVHAPAIARRPGVYLYRHFDYGPVRADAFDPIEGIGFDCADDKRVTGAGHLDYLDEASLARFYESPGGAVRDHLLADINILGGAPGRTTTYRTSAGNAHTYLDMTGEPAPQGPVASPRFAVFWRSRGAQDDFRAAVRSTAERWSAAPGVRRVRLHLFDVPDMGVESANGYPIHPAPVEEHYQAWIDIVLDDADGLRALLPPEHAAALAATVSEIHVQPVPLVYTYVWGGRPTVVGLRGYPAYELITELGAANQLETDLLEWLYGPVVHGSP